MAFLGLEFDTDLHLEGVVRRLQRAQVSVTEDVGLAAIRNVKRVFRVVGPDDTPLELYVGGLISPDPFISPTGARFVTGRCGMGHVLLFTADVEAALHFYEKLIGFRRTDTVGPAPGVEGYFLNGGSRHHVIALLEVPGQAGLHHVFVEVDKIVTVGIAWDRVVAGAAPIVSTLGQHANDPALSFYVESPSEFAFEYGHGSLVIDDPAHWIQTRWDRPFLWGGHPGPGKKA